MKIKGFLLATDEKSGATTRTVSHTAGSGGNLDPQATTEQQRA
jgi:hypothetical protein